MNDIRSELPEVLEFRPRYIPDPAPPWILRYLNENEAFHLQRIALQAHINILQAQVEAYRQFEQVIGARTK